MQLSLISSNQDVGTHFSFVFLKTINTSLIKAGCSRAVTQQCHPVCQGHCPPCKHHTPTEPRFAPRVTPVWHNKLLLRVFSTISKGSAHLQIKTTGTALLCPGCGWNMTLCPTLTFLPSSTELNSPAVAGPEHPEPTAQSVALGPVGEG